MFMVLLQIRADMVIKYISAVSLFDNLLVRNFYGVLFLLPLLTTTTPTPTPVLV